MRSEQAGGASGFADDEFRGEGDFRNKGSAILDAVEEGLCGDGAHFEEGLVDGGKRRDGERGEGDVVEADDGDVAGNAEAGFVEDDHSTHGGSVVIGEKSSEWELGGQQRFRGKIADIRSVWGIFELEDKFRMDREIQFGGNFLDGVPARDGVRTGRRPAEKSDTPVAEVDQMLKDKPCGAMVIEDYIGDVGDALMAADGNGRKSGLLVNGGVNGDDTFSAAVEKQLGIRAHELVVMVVGDGEKEEIVLAEKGLDTADDRCAVGIADFFGDDADGVAALDAERTREEIWPIVELASGIEDTGAGVFRDGACGGRIVENTGNRSGRKAEMQTERLEGDGRRLGEACLRDFFHGAKTRGSMKHRIEEIFHLGEAPPITSILAQSRGK